MRDRRGCRRTLQPPAAAVIPCRFIAFSFCCGGPRGQPDGKMAFIATLTVGLAFPSLISAVHPTISIGVIIAFGPALSSELHPPLWRCSTAPYRTVFPPAESATSTRTGLRPAPNSHLLRRMTAPMNWPASRRRSTHRCQPNLRLAIHLYGCTAIVCGRPPLSAGTSPPSVGEAFPARSISPALSSWLEGLVQILRSIAEPKTGRGPGAA